VRNTGGILERCVDPPKPLSAIASSACAAASLSHRRVAHSRYGAGEQKLPFMLHSCHLPRPSERALEMHDLPASATTETSAVCRAGPRQRHRCRLSGSCHVSVRQEGGALAPLVALRQLSLRRQCPQAPPSCAPLRTRSEGTRADRPRPSQLVPLRPAQQWNRQIWMLQQYPWPRSDCECVRVDLVHC
jgi:hypothetical protein